jgi:hypothetical protein
VCNPGYQDPAGWQDAGLLNYMFIATVALLTAGIDVVRSIHSVKGKAAASRDTTLLTLVAIFILLPCLLYPYSLHGSIPPLFEGQDITGCVISFDIALSVTKIFSLGDINIG